MDDCLVQILCCCCNQNFCDCLGLCCSKCYEIPGHCLSGMCHCLKESCTSMDCTCLSNVLCACWKCTDTDCNKIFNNSACESMEENCLKVFNCSESITWFSGWFQMFWMMRIRCLGNILNFLCNCMPNICYVTLGVGNYSYSDENASKSKNQGNSTKEDQNSSKKKKKVDENCEIIVIQEEIEEGSFQYDHENNQEVFVGDLEEQEKE